MICKLQSYYFMMTSGQRQRSEKVRVVGGGGSKTVSDNVGMGKRGSGRHSCEAGGRKSLITMRYKYVCSRFLQLHSDI